MVNKGRSRSADTNAVLRRLYLGLACEGIHLQAEYVASKDNITDALLRGLIGDFLGNFPAVSVHSCSLPPTLVGLLVSL